jgi:hypothetical protein
MNDMDPSSNLLKQLAMQQRQQQQGQGALGWLKQKISPTSTAGTVGNDGLYRQYVMQASEQGMEPLSREDFLKALQGM